MPSTYPAGVAEEIAYVGAERQDRYEHYDWNFRVHEVVGTGVQRTDIPMRELKPAEQRGVATLLKRLDIDALAERRFLTLSYGERRLVLIARALASRPKLLLLDEVANGLDARNHARFLHWLNGTARSAMPWVFATHRSSDVPESMTHLLELEQGVVKRSGALRANGARELLQQEARAFHSRESRVKARPRSRRVVVALRNADVHVDEAHILAGIELEVRAGDCWVVHGPNGSGKSTLLRTIYGDHAVASGGTHRARRHRARSAARKIQTAHGLRGAAPADLASPANAGDGSRGVGPLRQHWPQRGHHCGRPQTRRTRTATLRDVRACASGRSPRCPMARRDAYCSREPGRVNHGSRCSTSRLPGWIVRRART